MIGRLEEMKHHHLCIGDIRGKGLFAAIQLVKDRATRAPLVDFNHGSPAIGRIVAEAREAALSSMPVGTFLFSLPFVITQQELDYAMDMLNELLVYADEADTFCEGGYNSKLVTERIEPMDEETLRKIGICQAHRDFREDGARWREKFSN